MLHPPSQPPHFRLWVCSPEGRWKKWFQIKKAGRKEPRDAGTDVVPRMLIKDWRFELTKGSKIPHHIALHVHATKIIAQLKKDTETEIVR